MAPPKVRSEKETRKHMLDYAEHLGVKPDVLAIMKKYDNLLRSCTNEQERDAIAIMGNKELHFYLSKNAGALMVNGKVVD